MRWIAILLTCALISGCKSLEVKQMTVSLNLNLNVPTNPGK